MREDRVVEAVGLEMSFGSTRALCDVSLHVRAGECLGLVGRNGAGKSTMVSILTGLRKPNQGEVFFEGQPAPPAGHPAAWREHVSCVYQHSMLVPTLTVAENVFLNRPRTRAGRFLDWRRMRDEAQRIMTDWGFDVDVTAKASEISVEQRQVVEIARALSARTRCLILDEPTAALERGAVERLFGRIRPLLATGVGIVYISHHLEEVYELCDRITVLRDGQRVVTAPTSELAQDELVAAMVGEVHTAGVSRDAVTRGARPPAEAGATGKPVLVVDRLSAETGRGRVEEVSLSVRAGECVGLMGLRGSGSTVLADVIAGLVTPTSGEIRVGGQALKPGRPDVALDRGVGYVPEDRHARGFVPLLSVAENVTMTVTARLSRRGVLSPARRQAAAQALCERLDVVSAGAAQPAGELSGGNQQKTVVGRALARDPKVIVAVGPTQGVDVASKESLMGSLDHARREGAAVLLVSDDLDDLEHATRVIVLVRGQVFAEFTSAPWDRQALIAASEGLSGGADDSGQMRKAAP